MRRFRRAVLGGTFDHLHVGHQALLTTAFQLGDDVAIGLTTDRFLAVHPKPGAESMQSFAVRHRALVRWVTAHFPRRKWSISPLENPFGGSLEPGVGVLVVSAETERGGRAVNRERRRLGRAPVPVVRVPLVLADDLEPVSSRRIRSQTIGPDGRRLAPIRIALSTRDPSDRGAALRAIRTVFPQPRIVTSSPPASRPRRRPNIDLAIEVSRRTALGWSASERSPKVRLRPQAISGSRPTDLERGLVALLRPQQ